jgi:hypothetical protein
MPANRCVRRFGRVRKRVLVVSLLGVTTMRELELRVEDHQITVNMIDTKLSITYQLSPEGHLEENTFWTLDGGDAEFRERAWQAAHSKARQLAWIPRLKSVA